MTEPKNCPFCGSRAMITHDKLVEEKPDSYSGEQKYSMRWIVMCPKCEMVAMQSDKTEYTFDNYGNFRLCGGHDGLVDVISRWNKRA